MTLKSDEYRVRDMAHDVEAIVDRIFGADQFLDGFGRVVTEPDEYRLVSALLEAVRLAHEMDLPGAPVANEDVD